MSTLAAVHSSTIGLWAAVGAVLVDSAVTLYVGFRLNRTAQRETAKAAETVKPAIGSALNDAVVNLLPILVNTIKQHLTEGAGDDDTPRTIRSIDRS